MNFALMDGLTMPLFTHGVWPAARDSDTNGTITVDLLQYSNDRVWPAARDSDTNGTITVDLLQYSNDRNHTTTKDHRTIAKPFCCETFKSVFGVHDGPVKSGKFKDASVAEEVNYHQTSIFLWQTHMDDW